MGVTEDSRDDMVIVTQNGILIRQKVADVSVIGRNTQGVRLINPDEGDQVIDVAQVSNQDEEEEVETAVDATSEEVSETGEENTAEENGKMKALWHEVQRRAGWK